MRIERILANNPGPFTGPGTNTWLVEAGGKPVELTIDEGSSLVIQAGQAPIVDGELRWVGQVGTGFKDRMLDDLMEQLQPLVTHEFGLADINTGFATASAKANGFVKGVITC